MAKRGESIVEVVVACGILSLLFASVATLIVGTVRLNNNARLRMEAVSLAQTKLNEFVVEGRDGDASDTGALDTGTCVVGSDLEAVSPVEVIPISGDKACQLIDDDELRSYLVSTLEKDKCSYIVVRGVVEGGADDETSGGALVAEDFVVVESYVRWVSQNGVADKYVIRRLQGLR